MIYYGLGVNVGNWWFLSSLNGILYMYITFTSNDLLLIDVTHILYLLFLIDFILKFLRVILKACILGFSTNCKPLVPFSRYEDIICVWFIMD